MPRPLIDIDPTLHGAMQSLRDRYDLDRTEVYELAAATLVALDPESKYQPDIDAPVDGFLDDHCEQRN